MSTCPNAHHMLLLPLVVSETDTHIILYPAVFCGVVRISNHVYYYIFQGILLLKIEHKIISDSYLIFPFSKMVNRII